MIALSLIAVVYIGFVALVQEDMKKLVAYSSIAHMGFVTLGFFMFSAMGIEGALVQMVSHGFVSGAMFFCIGVMYDRVHSRQIADYGRGQSWRQRRHLDCAHLAGCRRLVSGCLSAARAGWHALWAVADRRL